MGTSLPQDPRPTWDKAVGCSRWLATPDHVTIYDHLQHVAEAIRATPLSRVCYDYPGLLPVSLGLSPFSGPESMWRYPISTAQVSRLAPEARFVIGYTDVRGVRSERLERALPEAVAILEGWLLA